eukprot:TRINITY_DN1217_c0_g1_i4.p1 TRINITY_DN1217_c0_g1~~TRINITY_DN1217_c0_g1_i4.p1  ORF type:complete len:695 (+),score=301.29 TRINITY_DN1217_c0_g1_i4:156-2240(+)
MMAEVDAQGFPIDLDVGCYQYDPRLGVNGDFRARLDQGMPFGNCAVTRDIAYPPDMIRMSQWFFWNAARPDTPEYPLAPAEEMVVAPPYYYFHWVNIMASYAVTHPDADNEMGPRQGNRTGYFSYVMEGEVLAQMFTDYPAPAGSVLYAVDRNAWTGKTGNVFATTEGRMTDWTQVQLGNMAYPMPWRVPLNVTDHNTNASDPASPLTVVGQHGRYVFAQDGNYDNATALSQESFIEWADGGGVEYWCSTRLSRFSTLELYVNLLVPRSVVMESIDASEVKIRADKRASEEAVDGKKQDAMIVTIAVTASVALVLMGLSVALTHMILAPLNSLREDMACVATMHVEAVDLDAPLSKLSEVNSMEQSFQQLVRNLVEYKQYMPASILVHSSEDEADVDVATVSSMRSKDTQSVRSTSSYKAAKAQATGRLADATLRAKVITVVSYNVTGWLPVAKGLMDHKFQDLASNVTGAMLASVTARKGVIDLFSGDHFLAAHNAFQHQGTHRASAIRAALDAVREVARGSGVHALRLSYGACSGDARIGQMGCTGMKKVTITSPVVPFAFALEAYNNARGYGGVADAFLATEIGSEFELRKTDMIRYNKRTASTDGRNTAIVVHEVLREVSMSDGEWMYQLDAAATGNPHRVWDAAFEAAAIGDWAVAAERVAALTDENASEAERARLQAAVEAKAFGLTL